MRSRRARRILRGSRVVLGIVVAATLLQGGPADAVDDVAAAATLGGYQGTAAASGLHALYNAGDVLPLPPPVDIGAPDALATIASGPSTFARASVADPGDLLANPDAILVLASAGYPAGSVPPYPFRVSAASGVGAPTAEVAPAPGLDARVRADGTGSSAEATMPAVDAPAVATFGTLSAAATTLTDGSSVRVHARSRVSGFDVLGIVGIQSITTDLVATSEGGDTKLTGGTTVAGATLLGQPITIDADGIHGGNGSGSVLAGVIGPLTGSLNDVLKAAGIKITLAGPVKLESGAAGQLTSVGLRIDLELSDKTLPGLNTLINALPPIDNPLPGTPSVEDLLQVAKARHLVSIAMGSAQVALAARPGFEGSTTTPSNPPVDLGSSGSSFDLPGAGVFESPSQVPSVPTGTPVAPTLASDTPALPKAVGVGSLVLLALLALPFLGDRLAAAALAILGTATTDDCPLEEP